jgi:plasmid stabilization system protein ParE
MDYKVIISEAAEYDIEQAFEWYELQKSSLGNSYKTNILKAMESIQKNPFKVQVRYKDVRIFFLKKFPYGIHFNINENIILIIAVFHTSKNPNRWIGV